MYKYEGIKKINYEDLIDVFKFIFYLVFISTLKLIEYVFVGIFLNLLFFFGWLIKGKVKK